MLIALRRYLINLTSKAAWFRKRILTALAVFGVLFILASLAFSRTEAEQAMNWRVVGFFGLFALIAAQAQYLGVAGLHTWLVGNRRVAMGRLIGVLLLFGAAYFLIGFAETLFPVIN